MHILKYRTNELSMKTGGRVGGLFKITKYKADANGNPGICTYDGPKFHNLITDAGLNFIGDNSGWLAACHIGTGSATPQVTDSALTGFISGTDSAGSVGSNGTTFITGGGLQQNVETIATASPWWSARVKTWRFPPGAGTGILGEVGIANDRNPNAVGFQLFSRELIRDPLGAPITITKLADEFLDVTYELRFFPNEADVTGQVSITTVTAGTNLHNYVLRPSNINQINVFERRLSDESSAWRFVNNFGQHAWTGPVGAITQTPSGAIIGNDSPTSSLPYVNNSLQRVGISSYGLNDLNNPAGIGSVTALTAFHRVQLGFTPNIMKGNTEVLDIGMTFSWARQP